MPNKQFTTIGEEFLRIARSRKIGTPRFRFPISDEIAYQLIGSFYISEVESRGTHCELDSFICDKIEKLARLITAENPKCGVLLTGTVGNGKTTLMRAFARAVQYLQDGGYIDHNEYGVQYPADMWMQQYTAKQIAEIAKSDPTRFDVITACPTLGLDELGEEATEVVRYGNSMSPITDLAERRYTSQRFTMITTNLDPEEIAEKYGARVADRFREMLAVIVFGNHKSYRV